MNLWRVAIDEESGRSRARSGADHDPVPVERVPEPRRGRPPHPFRDPRGQVEPGTGGSGPRRPLGHGPSNPDNPRFTGCPLWPGLSGWPLDRILFRTSPQEDLFIVGTDGSGLRQLTDDAPRDRNPGWSPDGRKILFYSDRGGRYEAWTIGPDGGGLQRIAPARSEPVFFPIWSPDGRWLACGLGFTGPALIDLNRPAEKQIPERLPNPPQGGPFFAYSWSPDGKRLTGGVRNAGLFVLSLQSRRYERLIDHGFLPIWLPDGRHLLYLYEGKILALDSRTRISRDLLTPAPGTYFTGFDVSPDGRALYAIRANDQGDIGMDHPAVSEPRVC